MSEKRRTGSESRSGRRKTPVVPELDESTPNPEDASSLLDRVTGLAGLVTREALTLAGRGIGGTVGFATGLLLGADQIGKLSPERRAMLQETGAYLKELRELAGLTRAELAEALDLEDSGVLGAVEKGTATLSFELILRLAALLARHDPLPFIIRTSRTYNPALWQLLMDWGIGRVPLQVERERRFLNLYRRHDVARELSDEGFQRVLAVTEASLELALGYAAEWEDLEAPGHARGNKVARSKAAQPPAPGARKKGE
jgi:transcriptional regulator with XRE-family HTH domain